ncbi:MAG: hypothetical protein U0892_18335 [Pirellulales bacterium]
MSKTEPWSAKIDRVIEWLKWPSAIVSVLSLPLFMWALLNLLVHILRQPLGVVPLVLGVVGFFMLWRRWLEGTKIGAWLITAEHELTHALFAWITMHHVVRLRATLGRGGEVRFTGKGNWLITISPYFFPTAALLLLCLAYLMPIPFLPWRGFFLGLALGFHVLSTYRETHRGQTDLQRTGERFCWMFLPSANMAVLGLIVAWAHGGTDNVEVWWNHVTEPVTSVSSSIFGSEEPVSDEHADETESSSKSEKEAKSKDSAKSNGKSSGNADKASRQD